MGQAGSERKYDMTTTTTDVRWIDGYAQAADWCARYATSEEMTEIIERHGSKHVLLIWPPHTLAAYWGVTDPDTPAGDLDLWGGEPFADGFHEAVRDHLRRAGVAP